MVTKEVNVYGDIFHYNEQDQLHREDGPAVYCSNGNKEWRINGKLHRTDGPAVEHSNGDKFYALMGVQMSYERWFSLKDFPLLW